MAGVRQPRRGSRLPMLFCAGVFGIGRPQSAPSPSPAVVTPAPKADARVASSSVASPSVISPMPSDPTVVTVPSPLRRHVPQLEMSGLTWASEIGRYLVVIDDTVDSDEDARHGAFVLALNTSGVLDDQPLPVDGVDKIDDAEGITSDGKGTYYLQTSHSQNRRGVVKKPRRQLLRMKLRDRHLVVSGALDLLQGGEDVARQLAKLGVPADVGVDLEGLTYHDGALYVGLKWPLMSDGSALVMRMNHPDQVFSRGRLVDGDLTISPKDSSPSSTTKDGWSRRELLTFSLPRMALCTCARIRPRDNRKTEAVPCGE